MGVRLTDEQVVEIRERFKLGEHQLDLAAEYGIGQNTVSSLVTGRTRQAAGGPITRNGSRKLTPDDVVALRLALADGARPIELARRFSVTQQMVSQIATGRAYGDVGGPLKRQLRPPAKPLTVEQVAEIQQRVSSGEARQDVATAFGVSRHTVDSVVIGRLPGRAADGASHLSREVVRSIRNLYAEGASQVELARQFGTTQQGVSMVVRGVTFASYGGPFAGRRRHKLTADQVRAIREAYDVGTSPAELADRYGRDTSAIHRVLTGVTYPSAPGPTFALDAQGTLTRRHAEPKGAGFSTE